MQYNDRKYTRKPFRPIHIETVLDEDSMVEHQSIMLIKNKDDRRDDRVNEKKLAEIHRQLNRYAVTNDDQYSE